MVIIIVTVMASESTLFRTFPHRYSSGVATKLRNYVSREIIYATTEWLTLKKSNNNISKGRCP